MQKDRKHFKPKMFVLIKDVLDSDFVGNSLIQAQTESKYILKLWNTFQW